MCNPADRHDGRHSRFELKTLLETSRSLIESQDLDFILNNLLLISMGKLMISRGLILLYRSAGNQYIVSKSKGWNSPPKGMELDLELNDDLFKKSMIECGIDKPEMPQVPGYDDGCTLFNLRTRNNHIGFLCLGQKVGGQSMNSHEAEFIESLSMISASAIANSRLFTELRQTNRKLDRRVYELNTLFELSKNFDLMVDRDEIVRAFKFTLLGQLLIKQFFFVFKEQNRRNVVTVSGIKQPLTEDTIDQLFALEKNLVEVDDGLAAQIPFLRQHSIKAIIPLHFQNEKIGLVGLGTRFNKREYGISDYHFLRSLGNLAVLSIKKVQLLEERIEKERMEEELLVARNIQQGLFPDPIPACENLDISAASISSRQVGGDYYDILKIPEEHLLFAIGDVAGKGAAAALLMANLQAMLHLLLPAESTLAEDAGRMNDIIYQNTPPDKFITFFWGIFNPKNYAFRFVNAGHNPPIWLKVGEHQSRKLTEGGLILGAIPTADPYQEGKITLSLGDLLVFYTDGITEAMNKEETEEFGEERLTNCIKKHRNKSAERIKETIIGNLQTFCGRSQKDDITLIIVKVSASPG